MNRLLTIGRGERSAPTSRAPVLSWDEYGIYGILVIMFLIGVAFVPSFFTPRNLSNVMIQSVALGIVATGQTIVALTAGIDLSVAAVMSGANVLAAGIMMGQESMIVPAVVVALSMGVIVGLCNGIAVTRLRVPAIIATLGMMEIVTGPTYVYAPSSIGSAPDIYLQLADGSIGPVRIALILLAVVLLVAWVIVHHTRLGRYLFAIGDDPQVARQSGIRVNQVLVSAYVMSGFLAALAGLFLTARLGSGLPFSAKGFDLDSIAAVVIGGTNLYGGRGGIPRTLAGVLIAGMLNNFFNLVGVDPFWQQVAKGVIIVTVVLAWTMAQRRTEKA
jgi:ribose transport system permease protein